MKYKWFCDVDICFHNREGKCILAEEARRRNYGFYCPWLRKVRIV
jgi:hypothetical protein